MEIKTIDQLLEKYYAGETDEREETLLMDYFASGHIPERLQVDRRLFEQLYGARPNAAPDRIAERMARQIDTWNTIERNTTRHIRTASLRWMTGIAASVLLVCAVGITLHQREDNRQYAREADYYEYKDTYDNPEQAYAAAQIALVRFSRSLNKGLRTIENNTKNK